LPRSGFRTQVECPEPDSNQTGLHPTASQVQIPPPLPLTERAAQASVVFPKRGSSPIRDLFSDHLHVKEVVYYRVRERFELPTTAVCEFLGNEGRLKIAFLRSVFSLRIITTHSSLDCAVYEKSAQRKPCPPARAASSKPSPCGSSAVHGGSLQNCYPYTALCPVTCHTMVSYQHSVYL
jgi:hypothetical protein